MDPRATELMACIETPPMGRSDIARVTSLLRSIREEGISRSDHPLWLELSEMVRAWAERAQLAADTASILAELGDLMASRLHEGDLAATLYVRSLTLQPADFSVSERATLHLTKLHAHAALAHVLHEHACVLDLMPWVDEKYQAAARAKLSQLVDPPSAALPPRAAGPHSDDTPTAVHTRTSSRPAHAAPLEAVGLLTSQSRPLPPPFAARWWLAALFGCLASAGSLAILLAPRQHTAQRDVSAATPHKVLRHAPFDAAQCLRAASALPVASLTVITPSLDLPAELPPLRPHASLTRWSVRVHEDLISRRDVAKAVRPVLPELEQCYAQLFSASFAKPVELEVTWLVRPSGRTERVLLRSSTLPDDERRNCAAEALGKARFPEGERQVLRIRGVVVIES